MGLSYDPGARKWNLAYEKTDYKTDRPTYANGGLQDLPEYGEPFRVYPIQRKVSPGALFYYNAETGTYQKDPPNVTIYGATGERAYLDKNTGLYRTRSEENIKRNADNKEADKQNAELNSLNSSLNNENKTKNSTYDRVIQTANSTRGGDYVSQRELIRNLQGIDDRTKNTLEDYFKAFYRTEKLQTWNSNLGAKPPYGDFDATYYKTQNPEVAQAWQQAVANDDIDITDRYGENGYYLQHYTNVGKAAGKRGNKAQELAAAEQYVEKVPTEAELSQARTIQLGINTDTSTQRLLNIPQVAEEWKKAKEGDSYWESKAKEFLLDVNKEDEFAALFRLSDRDIDKAVSFQYNINADYGITELEDAMLQAAGEQATVNVKKFSALTQDVLKQTIDEMKKAKAKEQQMALFSGLDSFSEITNISRELTNSILGDSGVGGILAFTGGKKKEEDLEEAIKGISGVNNEVTYNWQQWFDETLKKRYEQDLELGLTDKEAKETIKIQGDFAKKFIEEYLNPRFNESRSMNEFVDYLDVREEEQNPFQTQDILNALQEVASRRADIYLDQIEAESKLSKRTFDSEFYFNPTGNKAQENLYQEQASTVAADWEAAKKGDEYWKAQAYRFGVDVNDKDAFARMHFQVKGQGKGYDPADDFLTASKVSDYIYNEILPALDEKALETGTFSQFIRPEEFADQVLKSVNPNDEEDWNAVLKKYGLEEFSSDIDQLRNTITETVRTGSAQEIREQIKYLNERKERPTQEKLGITYIQREEDYKTTSTGEETQLYKIFQSAGFQGTEDEFYDDFFPDLDRSEQMVLTKAGGDKGLMPKDFDFSDPFTSLGTLEGFFGEEDEEEYDEPRTSYFTIDDDEDDLPAKSKAGQGFLDDFTSMFKGFG